MSRAYAPGYDLFKLVVTFILAGLIVILLLRGCSSTPAAPLPTATQESAQLLPATQPPSPTATISPLPPTATATLLPPPTLEPTPSAAPSEAATPTPEPPPAPTAAPTPSAPPATEQAAPANPDCPGAMVSRLKLGDKVRVLTNLNLRQEPGLSGAWIITHLTGTELEIIGGPACTALGQQAYEWWQVRRPDGKEGWSAEASLRGQFYFLEPIP